MDGRGVCERSREDLLWGDRGFFQPRWIVCWIIQIGGSMVWVGLDGFLGECKSFVGKRVCYKLFSKSCHENVSDRG